MRIIYITILILIIQTALACGEQKPKNPSTTKEIQYIAVTAKRGLNLRQSNNIRSKKISALPYGALAPVIARGQQVRKIQGRNGVWLRTRYKKFEGWVFSGFVIFGSSKQEVLDYKKQLEAPTRTPTPAKISTAVPDEYSSGRFRKKSLFTVQLGPHQLTSLKYSAWSREESNCLAIFQGLKVSQPGKKAWELQARALLTTKPKLANMALVYSDQGGCSCRRAMTYSLYFAGPRALKRINLAEALKQKGECSIGTLPTTDTRFDVQSATLIQMVHMPRCIYGDFEGPVGQAGWEPKRYVVISGVGTSTPLVKNLAGLDDDLMEIWKRAAPLKAFTHDGKPWKE